MLPNTAGFDAMPPISESNKSRLDMIPIPFKTLVERFGALTELILKWVGIVRKVVAGDAVPHLFGV
jgi:hypothetical protein